MAGEGRVYSIGRAEIDTRRPFRSVKEAVLLFGETVLVGGIYADKRNEMKTEARQVEENVVSKTSSIPPEFEETRQMLESARKEGMMMVTALTALKEELQNTRKELQRLQRTKSDDRETELEDDSSEVKEGRGDTQRRKYVRFAKPHVTEVINSATPNDVERELSASEANSSDATKRNKKSKALFPALGIIFSSKPSLRGQ